MIGIHNQGAAPNLPLPPTLVTTGGPEAPVFDARYPATAHNDLQLTQTALVDQRLALLDVYPPWRVESAELAVQQHLGALLGAWEDPRGEADERLAAELEASIKNRDEHKAKILARYDPDATLPPDLYATTEIDAWNATIQELAELIADRRASPAPKSPRRSPYWYAPVRRAVLLEATFAPDPIMRVAARDLAERRLVLSVPYVGRSLMTARGAAHTALERVLSVTL